MAIVAGALQQRFSFVANAARMLHAWHLLSLDAPTVAFCWTLLFARAVHIPHATPTAAGLSCAVWLIYVADRLLDAHFTGRDGHGPLLQTYRKHAHAFLCVGACVVALLLALLAMLPRSLAAGWSELSVPLLVYAVAVHRLHLSSRWKPWCIGMFFAAAVVMPAFERGGAWAPLVCAALLLVEMCRRNCALLQRQRMTVRALVLFALAACALRYVWPDLEGVVLAYIVAYGSMLGLDRARARLSPLTLRALMDAALVLPALVMLAR